MDGGSDDKHCRHHSLAEPDADFDQCGGGVFTGGAGNGFANFDFRALRTRRGLSIAVSGDECESTIRWQRIYLRRRTISKGTLAGRLVVTDADFEGLAGVGWFRATPTCTTVLLGHSDFRHFVTGVEHVFLPGLATSRARRTRRRNFPSPMACFTRTHWKFARR